MSTSRTKLITSLGLSTALLTAILVVASATSSSADPNLAPNTISGTLYNFAEDVTWPQELPNNWTLGEIGGLEVDHNNNIWVFQRPSTVATDEMYAAQAPPGSSVSPGGQNCCFPAPPVLEFNSAGQLLNAWGPIQGAACAGTASYPSNCNGTLQSNALPHPCYQGPQQTTSCLAGSVYPNSNAFGVTTVTPTGYTWFASGGEHAIFATDDGYVWLSGSNIATSATPAPGAQTDSQLLKFNATTGAFVLAIGSEGQTCPNNGATSYVCQASAVYVDSPGEGYPDTNMYVADGFGNNRVIIFNSSTGAYVQTWGAYGVTGQNGTTTTGYGFIPQLASVYSASSNTPAVPTSYFRNVHCITRDPATGYVWVCDRGNDRIQVFTSTGAYVGQCYFAGRSLTGPPAQTTTTGPGSVWSLSFYPKRSFPHGAANEVVLLADGTNSIVREFYPIPDPGTGTTSNSGTTGSTYCPLVGEFGQGGRNAGYFHWLEVGDVDTNGTYYTGEGVESGANASVGIGGEPTTSGTFNGKRVQRFIAHP